MLVELALTASVLALTGCPASQPAIGYILGGTISGLTGDGLVLTDGGHTLTVISGARTFLFPNLMGPMTSYAVAVRSAPNGVTCSVADGSGTVGTANVNNVVVTCSDKAFTLGGTISGLNNAGLVLANGSDTLAVPANATSFTLPAAVAYTSGYAVSVATQPQGLSCSVTGGTGSMPAANVASAAVSCSNQPYALGGSISGLSVAGLVLANGVDTVAVPMHATRFGSNTPDTPGVYGSEGVPAVGNVPGARVAATAAPDSAGRVFVFGGTVFDAGTGSSGFFNDLWSYDPGTQEWTWLSGSSAGNAVGVYGALGVAAIGNVPGGRTNAMSWTDGAGHFWLFGGAGYDAAGNFSLLNDLWSFDPAMGQWTWVGGSNTTDAAGVYGTVDLAAAGNTPGARQSALALNDNTGHLLLFSGYGFDANGTGSDLNDLWSFDPGTHQWTWVQGSSTGNSPGVYGTATDSPGARLVAHCWVDSTDHLWVFGGYGHDTDDSRYDLNDLWEY